MTYPPQIEWHASRGKRLRIAMSHYPDLNKASVWAIHDGTHDLAPLTRNFTGPNAEQKARDYANDLWRRY